MGSVISQILIAKASFNSQDFKTILEFRKKIGKNENNKEKDPKIFIHF